MILVDSNIPMYLVGGSHPNKEVAHHLLESIIRGGERLVTDAEVLQEILHRYAAIKRLDAVQPAFEAILKVVDEVFAVDRGDVERAKDILLGSRRITARDSIHIAIMERRGVDSILSFDQGFDDFPGIRRIPR